MKAQKPHRSLPTGPQYSSTLGSRADRAGGWARPRLIGSLVASIANRELDSQHQGSLLGKVWALLRPLALILVYTLVFSKVMHSRLPGSAATQAGEFAYSIYLCAGLLPWTYFTDTVSRAQSSILGSAQLLKKLPLPLITPMLAANLVAFRHFLTITGLFGVFLLVSGNLHFDASMAILLPLLVLQTLVGLALGGVLAILTVYFRDIGPLTHIALQFGFWVTPVVYPAALLPDGLPAVLHWINPMFSLVGWYQAIALGQPLPSALTLLPLVVWLSLLGLVFGLLMTKRSAEIPDLI